MSTAITDFGERQRTFPKSVQPGIPKLGKLKSGWKRVKIGTLFEVINRPCQLKGTDSYRLVTVKRSRGGIESRGELLGAEIAVKSQFYIEEDDFLISKRQIVHGACAVVGEEFTGSIVSNEYAVLRCKPTLNIEFLKQIIHSVYFQQTCFHSSIGVHVEKMIFSIAKWFEWQIDIPELDEQRRIASFLGAVDAQIGLSQRQWVALERHKKGMMQRLFAQILRFKPDDGFAFPDWAEKRLGDIATFHRGAFLPKSDIDDAGRFPCIHYGELFTHYSEIIRSVRSKTSASEPPIGLVGDVIMPSSDVTPDGLARASALLVEGVKLGGDINIVRPSSTLIAEFFAYWVAQNKKLVMRLVSGTTVKHLYTSDLKKLTMRLPHPDEQRKMAAFLSALDEKIAAVSAKVDAMQTFKKGLLQQIFV